MRWYNIASGTLLILSIVDSALAAPVLVQEKRQARVDVVHIPETTVLGKRGVNPLNLLWESWDKYAPKLWAGGKPGEPSLPVTHAPSSSAPSEPNYGLTDVAVDVHTPQPNPNLPRPASPGQVHEIQEVHGIQGAHDEQMNPKSSTGDSPPQKSASWIPSIVRKPWAKMKTWANRWLDLMNPSKTKPSNPNPSDPRPSFPRPSDPRPSFPSPSDPRPSDPRPSDPRPSDPTPSDPTPSDPITLDLKRISSSRAKALFGP